VIDLFPRRLLQPGAQPGVARQRRLGRVKRLCAHFADMVHAHQRPGQPLFGRVQRGLGHSVGGGLFCGPGLGKKRAQRIVCGSQQGVSRGHGNLQGTNWAAKHKN